MAPPLEMNLRLVINSNLWSVTASLLWGAGEPPAGCPDRDVILTAPPRRGNMAGGLYTTRRRRYNFAIIIP